MNALEKRVEVQCAFVRHDQLTVKHKLFRRQREQCSLDFGEIASQRLPGLRHDVNARSVAKGQAAESVPLRLIFPLRTTRDLARCICLHRSVIDRQGKAHANASRGERARFSSTGLKRSPCFSMRCGIQSMRKSEVEIPRSTSCHVTGAETLASGRGRTE